MAGFVVLGIACCGEMCRVSVVIFYLLFISGFTGLFQVFSCVLVRKWLIINTILFSGSVR